MPTHTRVLLLLLGLSLIGAVGYLSWRERLSPASDDKMTAAAVVAPAVAPVAASEAFESTWAAIAEAEQIDDLVERCVKYPNPPGLHWDAAVVKAVCARVAFSYPSIGDIRTALDEGRIDEVERTYRDYLEQSTEPEKRGLLATAFRMTFEKTGSGEQAVLDLWVATSPHSAFALAARGLQSVARASDARGGEVRGRTEQRQFARMDVILGEARKDLEAALLSNPRLLIAYRGLFLAARMHGTREEIERYADEALKIDPADDRVYLDWMAASEPRWGGSVEQMERIARLASEHRDANPYLQLVMEKPRGDKAAMQSVAHRYAEALAEYEEALLIAPSPTDFAAAGDIAMSISKPEKALWYYSQAYRFTATQKNHFSRANALLALGKSELANEILQRADGKGSDAAGALMRVADAHWHAGRYQDAEKTFIAALAKSPKNLHALTSLAHLYITELHDVDKAQPYIITLITAYPMQARGWLYKAAGNKPKAETLDALKRYLQLVDRNDPYELHTISSVEAKIQALEQEK